MNRRNRNVAHLWCDKRVMRWFRREFTPPQCRNLKIIYLSLCEIESDFHGTKIGALNKTILKYAGVSKRISTPAIYFLEEIGLLKIQQHKNKDNSWGHSSFTMYEWTDQEKVFNSNKKKYLDILSGVTKRRVSRKEQLSLATNVASNKNNTKVLSSNKNDTKVSSKYTNVYTASSKQPNTRTLRKIVKKNGQNVDLDNLKSPVIDPSNSAKPKFDYNGDDLQLYNELLLLGATKHNEEKASYFKTMDSIHMLLNPDKYRPPYSHIAKIPDDYKVKHWTMDEIISTFSYYMKIADKPLYKNFSAFVSTQQAGGTKSWSPLVKFHVDVEKNKGNTLDGSDKILMKGLNKLGLGEVEASGVKKISTLLGVYGKNFRVSQQMNHIYYGDLVYVFLDYVKRKNNDVTFKPYFMLSENFMKSFITDSKKAKSIVKRNLNAGY